MKWQGLVKKKPTAAASGFSLPTPLLDLGCPQSQQHPQDYVLVLRELRQALHWLPPPPYSASEAKWSPWTSLFSSLSLSFPRCK